MDHYIALKGVCQYLRRHKSEGLIYWWTHPVDSLPEVPFHILQSNPKLPPFPKYDLTELVAFTDATYATEMKTQRLVTGYVIVFGGAAIAYKAKLQTTVATNSTKAEFITAIYTAKAVKHLQSILNDLGLCPGKPMMIYKDNKAAIDMINDSKPTACS